MSQVYVIAGDGSTQPMDRVHCANEDRDLQRLLENNSNLLPGDQMCPEDPRRWLLIKREMPVPDPSTGSDRWSIDFFFTDQSAIPTFVECKRYADSRARREVVGQMLEYAANGHYYWAKQEIRDFAELTAQTQGTSLEEAVLSLQPDGGVSPDEFFGQIQENLREGQIRIVFFLEASPMELRSIVDFLNKQMERSEVLLVEARQYSLNGVTVVAPTLFGFTEEARQVKRQVSVTSGPAARKSKVWDEASFFADAQERLTADESAAIRQVFEHLCSSSFTVEFGSGKSAGSINVKRPPIIPRALITINSAGRLQLNFGWLSDSKKELAIRDVLWNCAKSRLGLDVPQDYANKFPPFKVSSWKDKVSELIEILKEIERKNFSHDQ